MQRIVLMFPGALGDMLLALPAWRALRRRHPGAHVTLAVNGTLVELAGAFGVADAVVRIDGADVAALLAGGAPPPWLAARPIVYSWLGATSGELRARLEDLAERLTLARVERGNDGPHAAVAYAGHVGECGTRATLAADGVVVPPASARVRALFDRFASPVLVIHAGAGAPSKRWPTRQVAAVAAWWNAHGGATIELRGPAETEPPLPGVAVVDDLPLIEVADLLRRAAGYLGNDSGISHLAAAVGAPGVVVFGPTSPRRWRPTRDGLVVVAPCEPAPFADDSRLVARVIRRVASRCAADPTLTSPMAASSVPATPRSPRDSFRTVPRDAE